MTKKKPETDRLLDLAEKCGAILRLEEGGYELYIRLEHVSTAEEVEAALQPYTPEGRKRSAQCAYVHSFASSVIAELTGDPVGAERHLNAAVAAAQAPSLPRKPRP